MKNSTILILAAGLMAVGGCSKEAGSGDSAGDKSMAATMGAKRSMARRGMDRRGKVRKRRPVRRKRGRKKQVVKRLWTATGLHVPESVLFDPASKVLFVSCIHGKPTEKNGKGYIARLSLQGKVLTPKWAAGMDAPKGMGIKGGLLYVTDITRLHAIDLKTGKITKTINAPGSKFLNDVAVGPDGKVYVSDMTTGKLHVLKAGKLATLAELKSFGGANGLVFRDKTLFVGTAKGVVKVDTASGKAALHIAVKDFGLIDGLRTYGTKGFIMSNWKGRTQRVKGSGKVQLLLDTTRQKIQSADLEYLRDRKLLIIPTFFNNKVVAYRFP